MRHVAVIDYGMGNLRSVSKALETISEQVTVKVSVNPKTILSASHIVFPGVGAIRDCMAELHRLNLEEVIRQAAESKPFLGICLGMQALLSHSDENDGVDCLDIIPGEVKRFDLSQAETKLKVPHMGWNIVHQQCKHPLWKHIAQDCRFYFVHSFYASPANKAVIAATSDYPEPFTAAMCKDNVFAAQFHPEKSQQAGLRLLKNFINWDGQC